MEKFNTRDAKLISIIIFIMLVFVLVIGNAYKYLPEQSPEIPDVSTELNLPGDEEEVQATEPADEEKPEEETKKNLYKNNEIEETTRTNTSKEEITNDKLTPLENISEGEGEQSTEITNESFEDIINESSRLKSEKQYVKALDEYKRALAMAENTSDKALCYEEIANIYALAKRYGTALAYAQKAYNLSPSTKREVLLARLYYKTGDIDKASTRVNNVLKRDFTMDN